MYRRPAGKNRANCGHDRREAGRLPTYSIPDFPVVAGLPGGHTQIVPDANSGRHGSMVVGLEIQYTPGLLYVRHFRPNCAPWLWTVARRIGRTKSFTGFWPRYNISTYVFETSGFFEPDFVLWAVLSTEERVPDHVRTAVYGHLRHGAQARGHQTAQRGQILRPFVLHRRHLLGGRFLVIFPAVDSFQKNSNFQPMGHIRLNENETTSAGRIFLKIFFQEISEYMGLEKLFERTRDPWDWCFILCT